MTKRIDLLDVNFRDLVVKCANDRGVVAEFNQIHGRNLKCPIAPLVEPVFPLELDDKDRDEIAWFVAWVKHNHWARQQAAVANIGKLHSFYRMKRRADQK